MRKKCDLQFDVHICNKCPHFDKCIILKSNQIRKIIKDIKKDDDRKLLEKIHKIEEVI